MKKHESQFKALWKTSTLTAKKDLEKVLVTDAHLPMNYWRKNFFFKGMKNEIWSSLTRGVFPIKAPSMGTHPVYTLFKGENIPGFTVCPCSSSSTSKKMIIPEGTVLLYTNYSMDKTSVILNFLPICLPANQAMQLSFKGEVRETDIQRGGR